VLSAICSASLCYADEWEKVLKRGDTSSFGAITLHGPHQVAKKSINTALPPASLNAAWSSCYNTTAGLQSFAGIKMVTHQSSDSTYAVSKMLPGLFSCNLSNHHPILIIFGRNLTWNWAINGWFIFATSALPGKTQKHGTSIFSLKCSHYRFDRHQPVAAWFLQSCWFTTYSCCCMTP